MHVIKKMPCNKVFTYDLCTLNLVTALLTIADDMANEPKQEQFGLLPSKEEFQYPDGYYEMLETTLQDIKTSTKSTLHAHMSPMCAHKVRRYVREIFPHVLAIVAEPNISFEIFAMYLMYHKFVKREVVYEVFYQFTDETKYALVVDTMDTAGFKLFDKIKMHNLAKRIVETYLT